MLVSTEPQVERDPNIPFQSGSKVNIHERSLVVLDFCRHDVTVLLVKDSDRKHWH